MSIRREPDAESTEMRPEFTAVLVSDTITLPLGVVMVF